MKTFLSPIKAPGIATLAQSSDPSGNFEDGGLAVNTTSKTLWICVGNVWYQVSGGASATVTEIELDFGSKPTDTKTFTVTDAACTSTSKIRVWLAGKTATGRVGNDEEWDQFVCTGRPGTGSFTLNISSVNGSVVDKRIFYYTID